jgi:hypothetical protein
MKVIGKCLICGNQIGDKPVYTGYIFFDDGSKSTGVPFCSFACAERFASEDYANPVFESKKALNLFKKMYPRKFWKDVEGRKILFIKVSKKWKKKSL